MIDLKSPVDLKALVRTIPDFPKPGIDFRDISTLIADGQGFAAAIMAMVELARPLNVDRIIAIDARGFLFGAPVAVALGAGIIPARKKGKLPGATLGVDYALEYGTDRLELHVGAVLPGHRALIIDDLIATGGTAMACVSLLREAGAEVAGGGRGRKQPDGVWRTLAFLASIQQLPGVALSARSASKIKQKCHPRPLQGVLEGRRLLNLLASVPYPGVAGSGRSKLPSSPRCHPD